LSAAARRVIALVERGRRR